MDADERARERRIRDIGFKMLCFPLISVGQSFSISLTVSATSTDTSLAFQVVTAPQLAFAVGTAVTRWKGGDRSVHRIFANTLLAAAGEGLFNSSFLARPGGMPG